MGWFILIVIIALVAMFAESLTGKIVLGAMVLAIGFLLLKWITGIALFVVLAKLCFVVVVIVTIIAILLAIVN